MDITVGLDDLVFANAKFTATKENTISDYTPAFTETNDNYFRPQDVTMKIAPSVAGVQGTLTATGTAATTVNVTALSISTTLIMVGMGVTGTNVPAGATVAAIVGANAFTLSAATTGAMGTITFVPITVPATDLKMSISADTKLHQTIGNVNPTDVLTTVLGVTGTFNADYDGASIFYAAFTANTNVAILVDFQRTDLPVLGSSALKPRMTILLPKSTFVNYKPTRSIDDIVHEGIDFMAHYSATDTSAITVTLQNVKADYNT